MPKLTIKRGDATFEISDLSLDEVKELAGLNGHAPSPQIRRRGRPPKNPYLFHANDGPDYKHFYQEIGERGRKFFALLKQNPTGISGESLAEKLGFKEPSQIGGLAAANLSRHAKQCSVNLSALYIRERAKLDTGDWQTTYKPGPEIGILQ